MRRTFVVITIVGALSALTAGATASWMSVGAGNGTAKAATLAATVDPGWSHPQAFTTSANQIRVTWTPSASGFVSSYDIERANLATPTTFASVGSVTTSACTGSPGTCSFTDTTTAWHASYLYRVKARSGSAWTATSGTTRAISATMASATDGSGGTLPALEAVYADTDQRAWAVGANGTILATTNGSTWTAQTSNTPTTLRGVAFADATHGLAVGNAGTILTSDGTTWTSRISNVTVDLHAAAMIKQGNAYYGWAVGGNGAVLRSPDGGVTWSATTVGTAEWRSIVTITSSNVAIVGTGGKAAYTTNGTQNGGASWTASTMPANLTADLEGVAFAEGVGLAVGSAGTVLTSSNNGQTWTTDTSASTNLYSVGRAKTGNDRVAVAAGHNNSLFTRVNTLSWTQSTVSNVTGTFNGVASVANSSKAWAVASDGQIVFSSNVQSATPTWTIQHALGGGALTATQVDALDLAGDSQTYTTAAGWKTGTFASGAPACDSKSLRITPDTASLPAGSDLAAASVTLRYSMSVTNAAASMRLLVSGDGGTSWTAFTVPTPSAASTPTDATVNVLSALDTINEAKSMLLCFEAVAPSGSTFTTTHDLVHVDLR